MSDFIFLVQLPVWQSASQQASPDQEKKCGMNVGLLDCWVSDKNCWALLGSVSNHIKVFILFNIPIEQVQRQRERQVCRTELRLISFCGSWFRNSDKIPFLVRLQLTVSTNHKICLLPISLKFISVRTRIFSVGKSFVFWDFLEKILRSLEETRGWWWVILSPEIAGQQDQKMHNLRVKFEI